MSSRPEPILEKIRKDVLETLRTVKRDNGYSADLIVEEANPAVGNARQDRQCVVTQGKPRGNPEEAFSHNGWFVDYEMLVCVVESEDSNCSLDHRLNLIAADIVRALCSSTSYSRKGLALDTTPGDPEPLPREVDANLAEMLVVVTVQFRHLFANPFAQ